jgi:RNA polymerase sigma-70 factor (ECF subfamily)
VNDSSTVSMPEQWLSRFRNGEPDALKHVYLTYVVLVRRWLRVRLASSGRGSAVLEDLVQETFAKAFSPRARARYDASRAYAPYLLAIARNCFVDWVRHVRRLPILESVEQRLDCEEAAPAQPSCFAPELLVTTARLLRNLPAELDGVYFRRYELDESQQRAAEALGISRQNLRTLERKLLGRLRRDLYRAGLPTAARSPDSGAAPVPDGRQRPNERPPARHAIQPRVEVLASA